MIDYTKYQEICTQTSRNVTKKYSTSFSRSILFLEAEIREGIYNIYGFVRLADEIVDSFHDFDKKYLLRQFRDDFEYALQSGISINPVIHSYIQTHRKYNIPKALPDAFLDSMAMDLGEMQDLSVADYQKYIYGSAEVVGLMCLMVFLKGNTSQYNELRPYAQSFGAALQKVNFLRDINNDYQYLNRTYFPNVDFKKFTYEDKIQIEKDIEKDFEQALIGIKKLPLSSRFAVYLAYRYYNGLFEKIRTTKSEKLFSKRIRINNFEKMVLFSKVFVYQKLRLNL